MIIVYVLIAILLFGLLIAVHEFGHFFTAKLLGVKVNEFSIGMGPQLLHTKKGETEYSLRAFPVGGFCAMEGEDGSESSDPRAFSNKPAWRRFIILVAGACMNFVVGVLIFIFLFAGQKTYISTTIESFVDGFSAQGEQGLMAGDRITKIDGHAVYLRQDISIFFERGGDDLDLTVERNGQKVELGKVHMPWLQATDIQGNPVRIRGITSAIKKAGPLERLQLAWYNSIDTVRLVWISLGDLVTGKVGLRDLSGVVGITATIGTGAVEAQETAQATGGNGFLAALANIFYFTAFIAINLAVMNLLPIPALDGGQILFLVVDKVYSLFTRRRIDPKYLGYINTAGLVCLLALMAVIAFSDVFKIFGR